MSPPTFWPWFVLVDILLFLPFCLIYYIVDFNLICPGLSPSNDYLISLSCDFCEVEGIELRFVWHAATFCSRLLKTYLGLCDMQPRFVAAFLRHTWVFVSCYFCLCCDCLFNLTCPGLLPSNQCLVRLSYVFVMFNGKR